jgi:Pyruvate/2-oxoglutarate dehydrogenase complex, dihydrolipoamide acyltransferase (E2) component, and related enzymes
MSMVKITDSVGTQTAEGAKLIDIVMPPMPSKVKKEKIKLVAWHKSPGDVVHQGDVLAVIETNKAAIDIEAEHDGVLVEVLVAAGSSAMPAGALLARLAVRMEAPVQSEAAGTAGVDDNRDPLKLAATTPLIVATPLATRIAGLRGIDLSTVQGSGPFGKIVEADLEQPRSVVPPPETPVSRHFELVPHDERRLANSRRLTQAMQMVPQVSSSTLVDIGAALDLCDRLNALAPATPILFGSLVVKAMSLALQLLPQANASWTEAALARYREPNVGYGVAGAAGTIRPVLANPAAKGLAQVSSEMRALEARSRSGDLTEAECSGAATAILFMKQPTTDCCAEVVVPPYGSVMTVGSVETHVVSKSGQIVSARQIGLTLCADHRCIDSALAARLVSTIRMLLEEPALMLA